MQVTDSIALQQKNRTRLSTLLLTGTALFAWAGPAGAQQADTPATAQTPARAGAVPVTGAGAAAEAMGEIVVTGSRASVGGFAAPTPTAVFSGSLLRQQAAATVAAVLNQNPAFKPTRSPSANATNTSSPGMATADLRALGGQRTLVLVNGSRVVPEAPANNLGVPTATDLNLIPTAMIDRVEVVTGGASAQYGSDAVAGVVNIILKHKMDGVEATGQAGISQAGDTGNQRIALTAGTSFGDDRGHIILSGEYDNNDGYRDIYQRDWSSKEYQVYTNSARATNGLPAFIIAPAVHHNQGAGSLISGPANFSLRNYTFNPDGTIRPYDIGTLQNGTVQIGGEGVAPQAGTSVVPAVRRITAYGRMEYQVSDALTAYVEGGWSRSRAILFGTVPRLSNVTIRSDNAFLPSAVRTALAAQGLTSFTISRYSNDIGNSRYRIVNETPHAVVGVEGNLGGSWRYDAHVSRGINHYTLADSNNAITQNYIFAEDAVVNPANGQIVCRATLTGPGFNAAAAGCVPINLFGSGKPSAAAIAYVNGSGTNKSKYTQTAAAANIRGNLFSTWAGPVASAFGIEYRRESERVTADAIAAVNGFTSSGNAAPFFGKFDVKEAYAEVIVPIARDVPLLHRLDLNGAVREADYSTVGRQTTYKVGGVWEPFDGLRLRSTFSRDIRAPALFELFSPGSNVNTAITVRGITRAVPQNTNIGNANLEPEKADTFTLGVVAEPKNFLRGLRFSLDYYNINLKRAITNLSAATIGSLCTLGNAQFCSYFTFDATGQPTSLLAPTLNIGAFQNIGLDGVLSYTTGLDGIGLTGIRSATSFSGTYYLHAYVDTGSGTGRIDRAGENTQANLGATPRFRGNLSQTFSTDTLSLTAQLIYISKGKQDVTYNTSPATTINDNHVPAVAYLNAYGSYKVGPHYEMFFAIDNLLDRDPPVAPYSVLSQQTNGIYYDKIGRAFRVGVTVRY